jgi:hypothetical protein
MIDSSNKFLGIFHFQDLLARVEMPPKDHFLRLRIAIAYGGFLTMDSTPVTVNEPSSCFKASPMLSTYDFCLGGGCCQQGSSGEQYRFHVLFPFDL